MSLGVRLSRTGRAGRPLRPLPAQHLDPTGSPTSSGWRRCRCAGAGGFPGVPDPAGPGPAGRRSRTRSGSSWTRRGPAGDRGTRAGRWCTARRGRVSRRSRTRTPRVPASSPCGARTRTVGHGAGPVSPPAAPGVVDDPAQAVQPFAPTAGVRGGGATKRGCAARSTSSAAGPRHRRPARPLARRRRGRAAMPSGTCGTSSARSPCIDVPALADGPVAVLGREAEALDQLGWALGAGRGLGEHPLRELRLHHAAVLRVP